MHRWVLTSCDLSTIAISGSRVLHERPCLVQQILQWKARKKKKALDFLKFLNGPNTMMCLGLFRGAGGCIKPRIGMLHWSRKSSFLLLIHFGENTLIEAVRKLRSWKSRTSSWLQRQWGASHPRGNVLVAGNLVPLASCCCSVPKLCPTLCHLMDCSTPGFPVFLYLLEFAQIHVHRVSGAIQPPHPLSPPSPSAFNLPQHQGLFQWISSSPQVARVLELQFQLQHQSFQWIFRVDFF